MLRAALTILGIAGDTGWFLIGLVPWVLTLGAATIEVECHLTRHSFRFPGWWKKTDGSHDS